MRLLLVMAALSLLAAQDLSPVVYPVELHSGDSFPRGDHGFVFLTRGPGEKHPFTAYRPDGSLAYRAELPDVVDAAFDVDGSAAVLLHSASEASVALLSPAGLVGQRLPLAGFVPSRIAFGGDHTLWVLGSPGAILRHYSRQGALLKDYLERPPISDSADRAGPAFLGVSRDRVGIYDPAAREWTELDFNGKVTGHWTLPFPEEELHNLPEPPPAPRFQGFGFTEDGRLFARVFGAGINVQQFDKEAGQWRRVGPYGGYLIGVNGSALMVAVSTVPLRVVTLQPGR